MGKASRQARRAAVSASPAPSVPSVPMVPLLPPEVSPGSPAARYFERSYRLRERRAALDHEREALRVLGAELIGRGQISRGQIARALGVSPQYVTKWIPKGGGDGGDSKHSTP